MKSLTIKELNISQYIDWSDEDIVAQIQVGQQIF
jgi:hypothetical protein